MRIPEILQSQDTIYHYCNLNTALENILFDKKIRLSQRLKSIDPIEKLEHWYSVGGEFWEEDNPHATDAECEFIKRLKRKAKKHLTSTKQVCFCMNDLAELDQLNPMNIMDFLNLECGTNMQTVIKVYV